MVTTGATDYVNPFSLHSLSSPSSYACPLSLSPQDLKDYMRQAGEVTYADAHKNRRNEGCVEFANYDDLKKALEKLDGTELNGKKIKLIESKRRR